MLRLITEYLVKEGLVTVDANSLLGMLLDINFLHYAILLFACSTLLLFVFSRFGTVKDASALQNVTFSKDETRLRFRWSTDTVLSLLLIGLVLTLWVAFSPWGIVK